MENNKYTPQQIAKAVSYRFKGGTVATVTTNEVVVRIGKSFTRLPLRELHQAVKQSEVVPKEDLHQLAKELNAKEDAANGISSNTGLPSDNNTITAVSKGKLSHREDIAKRYGIE